MIQKWILFCGFLGICVPCICQDNTVYINLYQKIAEEEMIRTGIPASIKLAQGMLESNCGKSDLACKANNHFGIKCGSDWDGKCYKKEDDDYEDGKLIKSCFREFSSVKDSYIAHSDFLTDPAKANRYGFLFKLDPTDYKGWAQGLSKAGYATDPHYADRLIDLIEKYQLYQLDRDAEGLAASSEDIKNYHPVRYQNEVKYIVANENDSPKSLAHQFDVSARQILKYNEDIHDVKQNLAAGTRVYLQPKRKKYTGHQQYYMLKADDDLVAVSQKYGIKMSALLKRNGLAEGQILAPNQKLVLKGKLHHDLQLVDPYAASPKNNPKESIASANSHGNIAIKDATHIAPIQETKVDSTSRMSSKPVSPNAEHIVSKGDTLYRIAQLYGLSVEDLKKMNNLSADTISVGQKLVLK